MTWAMLVPRKGTEFPWIAKRAARFVDQLGHNRVTLRCDNEPAIEAMAMEIGQARQEGSQTVPERPPVGESQSNGVTERAVGLVAGQVRTLEAALEHRAGTRIPPDARILCWLVEFAAYLMNRCDGGSDGKTPLQRLHGRRDNTPILEFGEKTWYMLAKPARRGQMGTAIPSRSVCGDAELVVGSSGCHRARDGDQDTLGEPRVVSETVFSPLPPDNDAPLRSTRVTSENAFLPLRTDTATLWHELRVLAAREELQTSFERDLKNPQVAGPHVFLSTISLGRLEPSIPLVTQIKKEVVSREGGMMTIAGQTGMRRANRGHTQRHVGDVDALWGPVEHG